MKNYFVNQNAQENGDHEVHTSSCSYLPKSENLIPLGKHSNCFDAIKKSRQYFSQTNGCYFCCNACHTS